MVTSTSKVRDSAAGLISFIKAWVSESPDGLRSQMVIRGQASRANDRAVVRPIPKCCCQHNGTYER